MRRTIMQGISNEQSGQPSGPPETGHGLGGLHVDMDLDIEDNAIYILKLGKDRNNYRNDESYPTERSLCCCLMYERAA